MYEWTLRAASKFVELYGTWPGIYTLRARVEREPQESLAGALAQLPAVAGEAMAVAIEVHARLDGAPMYQPKLIDGVE